MLFQCQSPPPAGNGLFFLQGLDFFLQGLESHLLLLKRLLCSVHLGVEYLQQQQHLAVWRYSTDEQDAVAVACQWQQATDKIFLFKRS